MSAVFYYFVVHDLGVARAMMVNYVVQAVGVVLGTIFMNEAVGISLVVGGGLIILGIAIVNSRLQRFFARQPVAEQVAKP